MIRVDHPALQLVVHPAPRRRKGKRKGQPVGPPIWSLHDDVSGNGVVGAGDFADDEIAGDPRWPVLPSSKLQP